MKKKILSIILAVVMIVGMLPLSAITAFAAISPETGNPELDIGEDGAYHITNSDDWTKFGNMVKAGKTFEDKTVVLETDLTVTEKIGQWANDATKRIFSGTFDGNGHTITLDLSTSYDNNALFSFPKDATIKNLTVTGTVNGNSGAAGIAAHAENTNILNCINKAAVSGTSYVSGICGYADTVTILNCINEGNISGNKYIGGILGDSVSDENKNVYVYNCINYGNITVNEGNGGGIVGRMSHCGTVENCFTSGVVSVPKTTDGGIVVGWANRNFACENCYYDNTVSKNSGLLALVLGSNFPTTPTFTASEVAGSADGTMLDTMNKKALTDDDWYIWINDNGRAWLVYSIVTPEKAATCGATGQSAYYKRGDNCYSDEQCTQKIDNLNTWLTTSTENGGGMLAATEKHTFKVYTFSQHKCSVCGATENHSYSEGKCTGCGTNEPKDTNYIERHWDDIEKKVVSEEKPIPASAKVVTSDTTSLNSGFYVVTKDVTMNNSVKIVGGSNSPSNLILMDGCTLTVKGGIALLKDKVLNIYGQKENTGTVNTYGGYSDTGSQAGIGGHGTSPCGTLTVHGGTIYALGSYSAGIGGAGKSGESSDSSGHPGGNITIYGGTVAANGVSNSPAIGGSFLSTDDGTLTLGDHAVIIAGESEKKAGKVAEYNGEAYVQIHFHNAETCESISDTKHKCSFCDAEEDHTFVDGKCICGKEKTDVHHTFTYTAEGGVVTAKCSECGEEAFVSIWLPQSIYDGSEKAVTLVDVDEFVALTGATVGKVIYKREGENEYTEVVPVNAGLYYFKVTVADKEISGDFTIDKATPTANDFNFIPPYDCTFDGQPKNAVIFTENMGMGYIIVEYQRHNGTDWDMIWNDKPTEPGKYRVVIYVNEGENYYPSDMITSDGWVFEITAPPCTHNRTETVHNWNTDHTACTATLHCNDCGRDILTENATKIELIEDTKGNCQTMGTGHYVATFASLEKAETKKNSVNTAYGEHNFVNGECTFCNTPEDTTNYFYIKNTGSVAAAVTWSAPNLQYSIGNKNSFAAFTSSVTLAPGETCYFKGTNDYLRQKTLACNTEGASLAIGGDIGTLLDGKGNIAEYLSQAFNEVFKNLTALTDISNLTLCRENTVLNGGCFRSMFRGCTGLTAVPLNLLPAKTLAANCYEEMFHNCTNLTNAPDLPADKLISNCYTNMFYGCEKLSRIKLYFTEWGDQCTRYFLPNSLKNKLILTIYCPAELDTALRGENYIPKNLPVNIVNIVPVTLSSMGGNGGTALVYIGYGEAMPEITVPTREGYIFDGYYDVNNVKYYNADGTSARNWDKDTASEFLIAVWLPASTGGHTHTFADTYSHNDTHHWKECTCGHKTVDEFEEHTFGEGVVDGNKTTYTCVCGYTKVVYDKPDDEGEIISGTTYTGISLTLGSDISINFYMNLTEDARQNGTMTFNIGGRIVTGIKARKNENGYYFSTPLTALEMAETVTATFTYNGIDYVQEYSVAEYIEEIVGNEAKYGDKAVALAKKIANYGNYAQIYLESIHSNVQIVDSGEGYDRMFKFGGDFDIDVAKAIEALANYKVTVSGTSDNLSLYGSTVYFDSATALNYYVTVKNGVKPTATAVNKVTGEEKQVEIKLYKGNIYIVSVKDITATELADDITVTINSQITLTGSVFAYCNSVVMAHSGDNATDKDTFAVNAMAAFYEYYKAAVDYAKTQG